MNATVPLLDIKGEVHQLFSAVKDGKVVGTFLVNHGKYASATGYLEDMRHKGIDAIGAELDFVLGRGRTYVRSSTFDDLDANVREAIMERTSLDVGP